MIMDALDNEPCEVITSTLDEWLIEKNLLNEYEGLSTNQRMIIQRAYS